jgi:transcriptional regulator with XRE-family HTH domain
MEPLSPAHVAFGAEIRRQRERRGWTQEQLGAAVGIHATYVGDVERGERNVSLRNIIRLGRALDAPPSELVLAAEPYPVDP